MKLMIDDQPVPPGMQAGCFGPNLNYRVRYEDDDSMLYLFFLQYQEPCLSPILEASLAPGDCFFDVGANIGIYSSWASRLVGESGQVHAFEPIPSTRGFLRDLLAHNEIENVHVEPVAIGSDPGLLRMYLPDHASGIASALPNDGEPFDVDATTLDRYLVESGCPMPTLIKIDVEGFELPVLRGAQSLLSDRDAPLVVFEMHDDPRGMRNFVQSEGLFRKNGYELFGLCRSGLQYVTDAKRGPLSMNTLAAHPDRHGDVIEKLRNVRFRRNQNW